MPKGSTCKAKGCTSNKTDSPELSFHSFPKNKERFKLWCDLLKRPDLKHSKVLANRMSTRVCSLHFEERMYMSSFSKSRLIWCALPKPVKECALEQELDSKVSLPRLQETITGWEEEEGEAFVDTKEGVLTNNHINTVERETTEYTLFLSPEKPSSESSCGEETVEFRDDTCLEGVNSPPKPSIKENKFCVSASLDSHYSNSGTIRPLSNSSDILKDIINARKNLLTVEEKSQPPNQTNFIKKEPTNLTEVVNYCEKSKTDEITIALSSREMCSSANSSNILSFTSTSSLPNGSLSHISKTEHSLPNFIALKTVTVESSTSPGTSQQSCEGSEKPMYKISVATLPTWSGPKAPQLSQPSIASLTTMSLRPGRTSRQTPPLSNSASNGANDSSAILNSEGKLCHVGFKVEEGEPCSEEEETEEEEEEDTLNDVDDVKCAKGCQCLRCMKKRQLPSRATLKTGLHRTYSGPIQRQIFKTKGGGRRTFMIVNKSSLKNLQAKGLLQPLKKYGNKTLLSTENLIPATQCKQILPNVQNPITSAQDSPHSVTISSSSNNEPLSNNSISLKAKEETLNQHTEFKRKPPLSTQCHTTNHTQLTSQSHTTDQFQKTSHSQMTNQFQTTNQAPVVVSWSATHNTDTPTPSFTFTVQIPPGANQILGSSSQGFQVPLQIVTPPVFIGGPNTAAESSLPSLQTQSLPSSPNKSNLPVDESVLPKNLAQPTRVPSEVPVTDQMPLGVTQSTTSAVERCKISSNTNIVSSVLSKHATQCPIVSTKFPLVTSKSSSAGANFEASQSDSESIDDPEAIREDQSCEVTSPVSGHMPAEVSPFTFGRATGPVKVRKGGVKIYKFVPGNGSEGEAKRPKTNQKVRWVAMPSIPLQPTASSGQTTQDLDLDMGKLLSDVSFVPPIYQKGTANNQKWANKELKNKYIRLLNKHRQRYHMLLKKYKVLEGRLSDYEDVGTPQQVIRDARKFLTEEHMLFLESQMFLKNRSGTGNRFSKKFMSLMIEYYRRSAAGYRYLRTMFTIPSVKTINKWINRPLNIAEDDDYQNIPITSGDLVDETHNQASTSFSRPQKAQLDIKVSQNTSRIQVDEHFDDEEEEDEEEEEEEEEGSSEDYDSEESAVEEICEEEEPVEEVAITKTLKQSHLDNQEIETEWIMEHW